MFTENQVAILSERKPPYSIEDFDDLIQEFNSVDRPS